MKTHSTRRAAAWLVAGLLSLALSTGLSVPATVSAATVSVAVENYDFAPASRTIAVGDVVHWTFSGDQHSVTSRDGLFDSGIQEAGGSFSFTFRQAGTYRYYCVVHPSLMSGTIVVRAAATPRPTVRPTAKPTPRPTAKPSATPRPTVRPTPTAATPTRTTAASDPSPSPSTSVAPSPSPAASEAIVDPPSTSNSTGPPAPSPPEPANASDATPIVAGAVLLVVIAAARGLALARRRRAS
ncbi:MAG: hypothetical protein HY262_06485 [Chloroflexi bacterium]|nr:hypothetical protein [Chloroflexota bacterium]